MGKAKTAVELACKAMESIDFMNERETMRQAKDDVETIARLFGWEAEELWRAACDQWYKQARETYEAAA